MNIDLMFKDTLNIPDKIDEGGDIGMSIRNGFGDDIYDLYMNKEQAITLVDHLRKVFDI